MPSIRITRHGKKKWRATVTVKGVRKEKLFPDATKTSKRKAIQWEEETKLKLQKEKKTDTDSLTLHDWAQQYLDYVKARFTKQSYGERKSTYKRLIKYLSPDLKVENLSTSDAYEYLLEQTRLRTGNASNKDRKFLAAGWKWGRKYLKRFPQSTLNPFRSVDKFPEKRCPRYIPPEEDFWKIYQKAEGQDKVMLLTFLHTAARRNEILKLKWADIDFSSSQIRLWTQKRKNSNKEFDLLPMTSELRSTLMQWWQDRPIKDTPFVFVNLEKNRVSKDKIGEPFVAREGFMNRICLKAGVKQFGFHSIRKLSASILYHKGYHVGVIQAILRHSNLTTTIGYLKSLGLEHVREALDEAFHDKSDVVKVKELQFSDVNNV